jgi:hypothetical protein
VTHDVAQVHNELRRGVLSDAMGRAVGDSRGGGIERYGETLTPVLDLWGLAEFFYLRAERLVCASRAGPAVAAENAAVALVNPAGSGALLVVEAITLDAGALAASTVLSVVINTEANILATLGTPAFGISRDVRFVGQGLTIGYTVAGTDPAFPGSSLESVRVPAGNMPKAETSVPMVLPAGFGVVAVLGTQNQSDIVNFKWRERRAYKPELP